ncbi:unnamed protein product [Rotaria sordida]|uniref:Uncharacterized protein n=1 Tax=Rotaria sordida TaxID=392033 RepID=A0A818MBF7_9BILA|nr:unnamed protein product [Rotaria sordida]CAF0832070.1 unnamed protein product [Rotaria sordida]CAF0876406.1 unnamed protein product [Rotaria sordida]CAF0907441.1 unnamed protein product [Rotaria sordida]CAF3549512.1 unnamed protein product [Rotaria sordida]
MAIKQEKQWSRYYTNKGHDGTKVHYRCNQVQFRGRRCAAAIYLHYPNDSDQIVLFRSANEHDHINSNRCKGFPEEEKENIEELFDLKLKPKKIYEILEENNFKITFSQLKNYLVLLCKKKFDASTLS